MKKIHFLFAFVILAGMLSAFTAKAPTTVYYRDINGFFAVKPSSGGTCEPHPEFNCEYVWTGAAGDNNPQNELNYAESGEEQSYYLIP
ncbi:MAG: hypothetical protein U1C70_04605 [Sediminibacterium sp.]|jgi:hypothetical protein|uniref:hypothetical protein n=1 Tax=Sediminibacterium sp. TaxID=1917865 RepID=UPI002ABCF2E0|nr:hypothetical protein [Sediminibacterium sp.]MDZ4071085.1 hypothetical protein [Sediminibacterium sp.]